MKGFIASFFLLSFLAACSSSKSPSSDPPFDAPTVAQLEAAVTKVMADHQMPGVIVGAWFPGRGEYVVAKGVRDRTTGEPMTTDLHFRIGSNTKAYVGTVVLQLVDEGRIKLDDTIGGRFPWVKRGNEITIRMLLNMTSGIPSYTEIEQFGADAIADPHRAWTRQMLFDYVKDLPLRFDPGTRYHYSNTNTILLGMIVEATTGKTIAQSLQERIYDRMGFTGTSWGQSQMPTPFAHGYAQITSGALTDISDWAPGWADAAGQIVSTMKDLKPWAKTLANPTLISPAMHAQRTTWVTLPGTFPEGRYGLALGTAGGWYHHQGTMPGYNSIAAYLPEMDATIVVLANTETRYGGLTPAFGMLTALSNILSPQYSPGK